MGEPLVIHDDEIRQLATRLAAKQGRTVSEVVLDALRALQGAEPFLTMETDRGRNERRRFEALRLEAAKHLLPGATSDHSDMYDEFGLPK